MDWFDIGVRQWWNCTHHLKTDISISKFVTLTVDFWLRYPKNKTRWRFVLFPTMYMVAQKKTKTYMRCITWIYVPLFCAPDCILRDQIALTATNIVIAFVKTFCQFCHIRHNIIHIVLNRHKIMLWACVTHQREQLLWEFYGSQRLRERSRRKWPQSAWSMLCRDLLASQNHGRSFPPDAQIPAQRIDNLWFVTIRHAEIQQTLKKAPHSITI